MQPVSSFLDNCCLLARNARFPAVELYLAYVHFCLQNGVVVQDQYSFLRLLKRYGLKYQRLKKISWMRGISVLPEFRVEPESNDEAEA